jgi:hypothetical protein
MTICQWIMICELFGASVNIADEFWLCFFWNSRFVLFVNKFMVRVLNVASVPLITMQCVLRGQDIAWRWVALAPKWFGLEYLLYAPVLPVMQNACIPFFTWQNSFTSSSYWAFNWHGSDSLSLNYPLFVIKLSSF